MFEYEGGYVLPHLLDYVVVSDQEEKAYHGKIGNELEEISMEEAAMRVMYNHFEENAWNIEGQSIIAANPKTPEEVAMSRFASQVGMENLEFALEWCHDISYDIIQAKKQLFESTLRERKEKLSSSRVM